MLGAKSGKRGLTVKEHRKTFRDERYIPYHDYDGGYYDYMQVTKCVHLKMVNFFVYKLIMGILKFLDKILQRTIFLFSSFIALSSENITGWFQPFKILFYTFYPILVHSFVLKCT